MLILVFISLVLIIGANWFLGYFADLSLYEIIFHINAPMNGVAAGPIIDFAVRCVLPAAAVCAVLFFLRKRFLKDKKARRTADISCLALCAVMIAATFGILDSRLGIISYATQSDSDLIEEKYVPPEDVSITFPEHKRNLIFIYLESMETTFADKESGGASEKNIIPGLTNLALENECFSDKGLNGGIALPSTTWTMGAMAAMTSGLPLKIPVYNNYMDTQGEFFPNVTGIGNILEDNGYTNYLMVGSDSVFGGRKLYFESHGDYRIFDFNTALENGLVDKKVFWGFEDYKLFTFAKEELTKLAAEDKPFNFTMLTVDTHFEDGYTCEFCRNDFDEPYANVYACSDRQVCAFVNWIKEQPFYENTTVILTGDHPTMDKDFCEDITDYERKTYTAVINGAKTASGRKRYFSTLDMFPTTLSALGADIDGDRLGLGTDLYSDTPTLLEEYGREYLENEFEKKSEFMDSLNTFSINEELAERMVRENGLDCFESAEGFTVVYALRFDVSKMKDFDRLEAEVECDGITETVVFDRLNTETLNYFASRPVFGGKSKDDLHIIVKIYAKDGSSYTVADSSLSSNFSGEYEKAGIS